MSHIFKGKYADLDRNIHLKSLNILKGFDMDDLKYTPNDLLKIRFKDTVDVILCYFFVPLPKVRKYMVGKLDFYSMSYRNT